MKKNFFFVIWADPKFYQTLFFLSQHFSEKNYEINIFCKKSEIEQDINGEINFGKNTKIRFCPLNIKCLPDFINSIVFSIYCFFQFLILKPEKIIFFNKHSLFSLGLIRIFSKNKDKFIYHNFDFDDPANLKSFNERILSKLEFFFSKFADFLVFPSIERANFFQSITKIDKVKFFGFRNCFPKKFIPIKSNFFKEFLDRNNISDKKIVCSLGSISSAHHLNEIIDSAKYINKNIVLIIGGISINNYSYNLKKKIKNNNLSQKIFIFENIKNSLWFEILFKSSLGLCFYEKVNLSHQYMAGTSTKFNNYLFARIPMIVNNNEDFLNFKKKFDIFEVANPSDPKNIAEKINYIIDDNNRFNELRKNLEIAFSEELNFEKQFEKSYKIFLDY
tara:strand:+ start:5480 stop:6649 length:1170 start_codon:yes stop_codon:yes gene_type:complete